jgi:transposase
MLNEADIEEAARRFKNMRLNGHERLRYHALLLVSKGYNYRETGRILLVDEETVSRWVRQYELGGLENAQECSRLGRRTWAEGIERGATEVS